MKTVIIGGAIAATILLAGCGKQNSSAGASSSPVAEPALRAWQQGDKPAALKAFLEANWSARVLFETGSMLSLSEDQFVALSEANRQAKSGEMMAQVSSFKQMAAAVAQAGREAAAKGDATEARKYFTALKQCGTALDSADRLRIVRLVGQSLKKMADIELAKVK
jgi:hypothetical protein